MVGIIESMFRMHVVNNAFREMRIEVNSPFKFSLHSVHEGQHYFCGHN